MYHWLWMHLPGSYGVRILTLMILLAGVIALLLTVVFPWVAYWVPFDQVDVGALGTTAATTGPVL